MTDCASWWLKEQGKRGWGRTMFNGVVHRLKARHPEAGGQSQAEILIWKMWRREKPESEFDKDGNLFIRWKMLRN